MEIKASATYLRISPRKLRLLTEGMVGMSTKKALEKIEYYPQRGKEFIKKILQQGVANAVNNFKLSEDSLSVKTIEIGEGPRLKRQDTSHGARFDRGTIHKKTAHLYLTLNSKEIKAETKNIKETKEEVTGVPKKIKQKSVKKTEEKK